MSTPLIDVSTFDIKSVEDKIKLNHPEYTDFKLIIPEWTEKSRRIKKIKMFINNKEYLINVGNHKCPSVKDIETEIENYKDSINASFLNFLWDDTVSLDDIEPDNNIPDDETIAKMKAFMEIL